MYIYIYRYIHTVPLTIDITPYFTTGFSGIALSICGLLCTWHTFVVFKVPEKISKRKKKNTNLK